MANRNIQYYYYKPTHNIFFPHPNDRSLATYDHTKAVSTYVDPYGIGHDYPVPGNSYRLDPITLLYTPCAIPGETPGQGNPVLDNTNSTSSLNIKNIPKLTLYDGTQSRRPWLKKLRVHARMTKHLTDSDISTPQLQDWFTLYLKKDIHQTQVKQIFRELSFQGDFTWSDFEAIWLSTDRTENYPTERAKFNNFKFSKKKHGDIATYYLYLTSMVSNINLLAPHHSLLSDYDQRICFERRTEILFNQTLEILEKLYCHKLGSKLRKSYPPRDHHGRG